MTAPKNESEEPLVDPDLSQLDEAVFTTLEVTAPYIPGKVRTIIYAVGGGIAATFPAIAGVVGGQVGAVLVVIGAVGAAAAAATAIAHRSPV